MLRGIGLGVNPGFSRKNERSCYFVAVGKGDTTREAILRHAVGLASRVGLSGLSIGRLAQELDLSKSGLFSHFHSKEALQIQVLEYGAARFVENVVKPALEAPRGIPRIQGLFDRWLAWSQSDPLSGGCFFVAMVTDLDGRPGPSRDLLVRLQRSWMDFLADLARSVVREGAVPPRHRPRAVRQRHVRRDARLPPRLPSPGRPGRRGPRPPRPRRARRRLPHGGLLKGHR